MPGNFHLRIWITGVHFNSQSCAVVSSMFLHVFFFLFSFTAGLIFRVKRLLWWSRNVIDHSKLPKDKDHPYQTPSSGRKRNYRKLSTYQAIQSVCTGIGKGNRGILLEIRREMATHFKLSLQKLSIKPQVQQPFFEQVKILLDLKCYST